MKTSTLVVVFLAVGIAAHAKNPQPVDATIYISGDRDLSMSVEQLAKGTASWMFARIGVRLAWRDGAPRASDKLDSLVTIRVQFVREPPPGASPGALALAAPFSTDGVAIWILYGRIHQLASTPDQESFLLAYVMAHELSHVLQRTDAHSNAGIMKANWDHEDHNALKTRQLEFTVLDMELIRMGLNSRKSAP